MSLFGIKKKSLEIDMFLDNFKNVSVWDQDKIATNYDKRLPELLIALGQIAGSYPSVNFLTLFSKEELRKSWYSENQGKVVLNAGFSPVGPEFCEELKEAVSDYKAIELNLEPSK